MIRMFIILILPIAISCGSRRSDEQQKPRVPANEDIEEVNRYLIRKDHERIENYVLRKNLDMKVTGTGLWYKITRQGTGDTIKDNDIVFIKSECSMLDGTLIYEAGERAPEQIRIGRSSIESGLNEGLKLMRGGGEAIFILPSYLGHGLIGDGERIPSRAILVFRVEVVKHNGKVY